MRVFLTCLCTVLLVSQITAQKFEITPINKPAECHEMAPAFYQDGIVFASNRKNAIIASTVTREGNSERYLFHLYRSTDLDSTGKLSKASLFSQALMSDGEESAATFSTSGDSAFITKTFFEEGRKRKTSIGLFLSVFKDGNWGPYVPFEHNSIDHIIAHAFLTPDGQTLYFSSNMKGGYGGSDIWKCTKEKDGWSPPENLGATINTKFRETYPFMDEEGHLYFSSDRPESMGGMDVFMCRDLRLETPPKALPVPINSTKDDFAFISRNKGSQGFITSNRKNGFDQLYFFNFSRPDFESCIESKLPKTCFTFSEESPLETASPIQIQWRFGEGTTTVGEKVRHCYPGAGEYTIHMDYFDTITQILYEDVGTYLLNIPAYHAPLITYSESTNPTEPMTFGIDMSHYGDHHAEHTFWYFDNEVVEDEKVAKKLFDTPGYHHVVLAMSTTLLNGPEDSLTESCVYHDVVIPIYEEKKSELSVLLYPDQEELNTRQAQLLTTFFKGNQRLDRVLANFYCQPHLKEKAAEFEDVVRAFLSGQGMPSDALEIGYVADQRGKEIIEFDVIKLGLKSKSE